MQGKIDEEGSFSVCLVLKETMSNSFADIDGSQCHIVPSRCFNGRQYCCLGR